MFFARITRDEAKEMVAWRCLAPAFRRLIFAFFFVFSPPFALLCSLCGNRERGRGGGFLERFSTPLTNDDCDVTTAFRDASVEGWLSYSNRRLPREKDGLRVVLNSHQSLMCRLFCE